MSLKEKVLATAKEELAKHRESGSWLNEEIDFDYDLRSSDEGKETNKEIFQLCKIADRSENRLNFECLMANLTYQRRKPVRVSLHPNHWKLTQYNRVGAGIIDLIYKLHEERYIDMKKGYRLEAEAKETRIWATEKLLKYFPKFHNAVIYDPYMELVVLKDADGKLKEYKNTAKTWRIRKILQRANKVNQSADIRFERYKLSGFLKAIFNRKFTLNGRLHTKGYMHYQGLSGEERKEITINGDPIIELDFSGLHPHLLYAKEGIQLNEDPYHIVDQRPEVRPFLKHILLCMINAKNQLKAKQAVSQWTKDNYREWAKLKQMGITSVISLMAAFREKHKPIAHHFCNGKERGLKVMNLDARIALDIVNHFAKQNKPILAIHDSFIVQYQYEEDLRQIMEQTYRKRSGGFNCPIK